MQTPVKCFAIVHRCLTLINHEICNEIIHRDHSWGRSVFIKGREEITLPWVWIAKEWSIGAMNQKELTNKAWHYTIMTMPKAIIVRIGGIYQ